MTKSHIIRCSDELWRTFRQKCSKMNVSCTEQIRRLMTTFIQEDYKEDTREIYDLLDKVYDNAGRITEGVIQRNSTPTEYEEIIQYCMIKKYPIVSDISIEEGKEYKGTFEW